MLSRIPSLVLIAILAAASLARPGRAGGLPCVQPTTQPRTEYSIHTTDFGGIKIRLLDQPGEAPATVANFLAYANRGDYDHSFFHRLIPDFVLQGGGFTYDPTDGYRAIAQDPPVVNEPGICNVRGTLAMAKLPNMPDSATNQFFINLADNTQSLGGQNGGFTVFAVVDPADLPKVDAIAALHREYGPLFVDTDPQIKAGFDNLPVLEILARDPNGWGCVKRIDPDPVFVPQQGVYLPVVDASACNNDPALINEAKALILAAMSPQVPERLVTIETVPEPAGVLQLTVGAALLALLTRRNRATR